MKFSDLRLDTVYADHDGRPIALLSLDKVAKPKTQFGYGTRTIRDVGLGDASFGVIALRPVYLSRNITLEQLEAEADKHRASRPEKETILGDFEIYVSPLRLIVDVWDDHIIKMQAEAERKQAARDQNRLLREKRAETIATIEALLPAGITVQNLTDQRDFAQIRIDDLLTILRSAQ